MDSYIARERAAIEMLILGVQAIERAVKLVYENDSDPFATGTEPIDKLSDTEWKTYSKVLRELARGIPPNFTELAIGGDNNAA